MVRPVGVLAKSLVRACAHQSVGIEVNTIKARECVKIDGFLTSSFLNPHNVAVMSLHELSNTPLPDVSFLAPEER